MGENATVLAWVGVNAREEFGPGIAVDSRTNKRHALLSSHSASSYVTPSDWTAESTQVLVNAVNWTAGRACIGSLAIDWQLRVNPPMGLWHETFIVSIQAKNTGNETGNYTARLYINGLPEPYLTVSLAPVEVKTVSFDAARDPVGTHRVPVGPHETSFRVRPLRVVVQAYDTGAFLDGRYCHCPRSGNAIRQDSPGRGFHQRRGRSGQGRAFTRTTPP